MIRIMFPCSAPKAVLKRWNLCTSLRSNEAGWWGGGVERGREQEQWWTCLYRGVAIAMLGV